MKNNPANRPPLFKLALFLASAVLIFLSLNTVYSFTNTLRQLDQIEADRDTWQRPSDVLRALDLHDSNTVVDLGSGAGYFALKLSQSVGKTGQVLAVDLRKLSLFFLWTRALLRSERNLHVLVATEDDPRLPESVDAVLICNTYHEFNNPQQTLSQVYQSLRPGGRIVILDRAPSPSEAAQGHEIPLTVVEDGLRQKGFEIVNQDDQFIVQSAAGQWWLLIGRKPI